MGARRSTPCAAASSSMARMHGGVFAQIAELARRERGHRHVVFLVRRGGQRIHARRMRQQFVLRGQRRGGDVRDHEARVHAAIPDQERRQARQRGVDEQRDAPLGQRADLGDRERRDCRRRRPPARRESCRRRALRPVSPRGKTSGLSVTPLASRSSTTRAASIWSEHAPMTCGWQRSEYGSCTLPHSRWLELMGLSANNSRYAAAAAICPGWPRRLVDARIEGAGRSFRRVDRQRARHQRGGVQIVDGEQVPQRQRRRGLRAVEQRQAFLGGERDRLESGALQALGGAAVRVPSHSTSPMPNNTADKMRERREIAAGADRTLGRHARQHVGVVEPDQRIDQLAAHAGVTARQRGDLERQHEPHHGRRQRIAHAHGMRQDQVALQELELLVRDVRLRQPPKAGIDAVGRLPAPDDLGHRRGAALDGRRGGLRNRPAWTPPRDKSRKVAKFRGLPISSIAR